MGVNGRLRWVAVPIGIAALLLVALFGTLWAFSPAPVSAAPFRQTGSSVGKVLSLSVPIPTGVASPVVSPTVTQLITASDVVVTDTAAVSVTLEVTGSAPLTASVEVTATGVPTYYVVQAGDTLFVIAKDYGTTIDAIMQANGLTNSDLIHVGQLLIIPGGDGTLPDPMLVPVVTEDGTLTQTVIAPRAPITERMTSLAQGAKVTSPFYNTTWLAYYGRPHIDVMGILGEYSIEELVPLLRAEAANYERANGDGLTVMPAFHLVYGMATRAAGEDNSYLAYIDETEVISYIETAEAEGWGVILDVQIAALSPSEAISPALAYLKYPNVHLAIDPEFAMSHKGQAVPGNPIGFVTAKQVNEVQALIDAYLAIEELPGPRILLVHQFQSDMIADPENLDMGNYPRVALTLSVDGWGGPWGKISKYNSLVTSESPFTAFKLFYRWDEPLLLPDEVMGNHPYQGSDFYMDVTPNLVIYQ